MTINKSKNQPLLSLALILLLSISAVLLFTVVFAEQADAASIKTSAGWKYKKVSGGVEVLGYAKKVKSAKVPKKIAGKKVKTVRLGMFKDGKKRTDYKCKALTIPNYVQKTVIDRYSGFDELSVNTKTITGVSPKSTGIYFDKITIGSSVRTIGKNAFRDLQMDNAKNLIIKKGVKTIGDYAFYDSYIDQITLPSSVTSIGKKAFGSIYPPNFKLYGTSEATKAYVEKYKLNKLKSDSFSFRDDDENHYEYNTCVPYNGEEKKPKVRSGIYKTSEYEIASYANNIEPGKATVTIKGKGYYEGSSIKKTFIIHPAMVSKANVSLSMDNKLSLSWEPSHGATSYEVVADGTKSSIKDVTKTVTDTSCTLQLAAKSSYNVYVYACMEIDGEKEYAIYIPVVAKVRTP